MRLEVCRDGLWIYPENEQDDSYIRDSLKVTCAKAIKLYLVDCIGGEYEYNRWYALTTEKPEKE